MCKIRVMLADDHPVVRSGIRSLLEKASDIDIVAEAEDGAEVLKLVIEHQPDVLVLDIEMPELSGLDVAQEIRDLDLPVRILALSAHVNDHYVRKALLSGAAGYLVKEEAPEMILKAVRGIAKGEDGWMSREVTAQMGMVARAREVKGQITPREQEVLRLVVDGKTNQAIALELDVSESTIEKHVSALLSKLEVSSRVEAAVQAVRQGWIS